MEGRTFAKGHVRIYDDRLLHLGSQSRLDGLCSSAGVVERHAEWSGSKSMMLVAVVYYWVMISLRTHLVHAVEMQVSHSPVSELQEEVVGKWICAWHVPIEMPVRSIQMEVGRSREFQPTASIGLTCVLTGEEEIETERRDYRCGLLTIVASANGRSDRLER